MIEDLSDIPPMNFDKKSNINNVFMDTLLLKNDHGQMNSVWQMFLPRAIIWHYTIDLDLFTIWNMSQTFPIEIHVKPKFHL
jgi:hypothetical protein